MNKIFTFSDTPLFAEKGKTQTEQLLEIHIMFDIGDRYSIKFDSPQDIRPLVEKFIKIERVEKKLKPIQKSSRHGFDITVEISGYENLEEYIEKNIEKFNIEN